MRSSVSLAAVALVASTATATGNYLADSYIIEFDDSANLKSVAGRNLRVSPHAELYKRFEERGTKYTVRREFDHDVFVGVSLQLNDATDIESLAGISGIKSFQPIRLHDRPAPFLTHVLSGRSDPQTPPDSESTHAMTGVDKLHAQGYFGKGIKIGIIDTGTDYTHPSLGGGFGKGFKVAGGYDLVGDNYVGNNTAAPDNDPLDQCEGHGTHVAGIIGANPGNIYNISGVAYEASLYSYRVFGCLGSAADDVIIDALTRAYNDGNDIITLSLGGPGGWTEDVSSVVASRIADKGRIVTIAAGNDGAEGSWYASGPGTGLSVISVASVENTVLTAQSIKVSDGYGPIRYNALTPLNVSGAAFPLYALSTNTSVIGDGCDPLPASTPDLSPYVVLVRRGQCNFTQKLKNIADKGGKIGLIYDNLVESPFAPAVAPYVGTLVSAADGAYLAGQLAAGKKITVQFLQTGGGATIPSDSGGLMSTFSTFGPSNDLFFKPAVAAPGGNIVSTYPVPLGSFAILSGTSMATPFVAGSAALLLQAHGKGKDVYLGARTLFETTAVAVPSDKTDGSPLQTLTQAGAGLINVNNAINYKSTLTPGEILLNDTAHFNGVAVLTIKNSGKAQTFKLTHVPVGTALTIEKGSIQPAVGPVPLTTNFASVTIIPSTIFVPAGASLKVLVTISPPKAGDKTQFPVYSGFIQAAGSLGETLHTSYLGLNAKQSDLTVVDNTDYYFGYPLPALWNAAGDPQTNLTKYTFVGKDFPTLVYRLVFGTPVLYLDLVSANSTFTPTIKKRDQLFNRSWWLNPFSGPSGTFGKVATVGPIATFKYQPRNVDDTFENNGYITLPSNGTFANGTHFPTGTYKVLLRALKINGDKTNEASYESWLSPPFAV